VFASDIANTDLVNSLAPNEDALIDIGSCRTATEGIRYLFFAFFALFCGLA
jgi:hypothetical protein